MIITESTVFVISTVQSAVVASILAKNSIIHNLVIVSYKGYTSINRKNLITSILKYTNINALYELDLWMYQIRFNNGEYKKMCQEVNDNQKIISRFNEEQFSGELFTGKYEFICEELSPLLTLNYSSNLKYRIIDHNVLSAIDRVYGQRGKFSRYLFYKWFKEKLFYRYNLPNMECGFSLMKVKGDSYRFVDYRNFEYKYVYSNKFYKIKNKCSVLLVDHPRMYEDIPEFYDELKDIDYIEMYGNIVNKYFMQNENIILKIHPFLLDKLNEREAGGYIKNIKRKLNESGYTNCYQLEEIIFPGNFCLEVYFDILKPRRVIGQFSSVLFTGQSLDNCEIEFISDCYNIRAFDRRLLEVPEIAKNNIKWSL